MVTGQGAAIAHQRKRLKERLRQAEPATDPPLLALLAELSIRSGLRRPPDVLIGGDAPFVCGLWRPSLVLPRELTAHLIRGHCKRSCFTNWLTSRRGDLLWEWVPAIARLLYFFHPAAHYIAYRTCLERELACDQAAMVLTNQTAAGYASTLVEVVSWSSHSPIEITSS